jgi:hypothetical protein
LDELWCHPRKKNKNKYFKSENMPQFIPYMSLSFIIGIHNTLFLILESIREDID